MLTEPYLEITTQIGCRVNCIEYCPQEIIVQKHRGMKPLTLENFKEYITSVPPNVSIAFSGFSEPFQNQETTDMALWAAQTHEVQVFSTLVGLTPEDAKRLVTIPFRYFCLHLPDACGKAQIPITIDYLETLKIILSNVKNLGLMNMGGEFVSAGHENIGRGKTRVIKGKVGCKQLDRPSFSMLPNGDVYVCCVTRGLGGKIGSLRYSTFRDIMRKFPEQAEELQTDPESICHRCTGGMPMWAYHLMPLYSKIETARTTLKNHFHGWSNQK